jgi:hypothetical protein
MLALGIFHLYPQPLACSLGVGSISEGTAKLGSSDPLAIDPQFARFFQVGLQLLTPCRVFPHELAARVKNAQARVFRV